MNMKLGLNSNLFKKFVRRNEREKKKRKREKEWNVINYISIILYNYFIIKIYKVRQKKKRNRDRER